ncbi:TagK domain-containing protein [Burkholderia ubonensis]|uniref:TagK domain-containing protein n=1 Tax=Burkholderia ubonensis TaxID=101571 RepID=A0AAW3MND7_9BURK|nr:TagK domain-containing protein [Burkholderia ubonensis]KVK99020.1 hypothetical protein WJ45_16260 [Burkholderia ubonensis]KVO39588.1 hypothetical protein WJ75_08810 [Burkholderia ubonensis]KVP89314.1 hypothetical protein WJ96_20115 [Burkholderia ubonensis]KVQ54216.1 hypothetical protein WK04_03005 [Burkholderia ubonensis]KWD49553.1 hypothetical protein WL66_20425 [Burkholderia ubonensis]
MLQENPSPTPDYARREPACAEASAAAQDRPAASPHVDLIVLGNALPRSEASNFRDLAALAGTHAADGTPTGTAAPATILDDEPFDRFAAPPDEALDPHGGDPLAALFAEYRHALVHGGRKQVHALKSVERPGGAAPLPDDPFADVANHHREGSLFCDLLGSRQSIDCVLDDMNAFLADEIFAVDARQDVLLLLAPPRRNRTHASQTAPLTRHEHHLISADSHFPMGSAVTDTHPTQHHDESH